MRSLEYLNEATATRPAAGLDIEALMRDHFFVVAIATTKTGTKVPNLHSSANVAIGSQARLHPRLRGR